MSTLGTRSRGSITMRMLMGENEAYHDGRAQQRASQGKNKYSCRLTSTQMVDRVFHLHC
jgi:hypothetical protein